MLILSYAINPCKWLVNSLGCHQTPPTPGLANLIASVCLSRCRVPSSISLNSPVVRLDPLSISASFLVDDIRLQSLLINSYSIHGLEGFCSSRTDEISILEIESIQLVAGLFCIHYILIHNEHRPLGIIGHPLPYLPNPRIRSLNIPSPR